MLIFSRAFSAGSGPTLGRPMAVQAAPGLHPQGPHSHGAAPAPAYRSGGTAAGWRTAHRRRRGSARRRAGTWAWAAGPRWRWSRRSDASGKEESEHLALQDTSGPGAVVTIAKPPHQADRGRGWENTPGARGPPLPAAGLTSRGVAAPAALAPSAAGSGGWRRHGAAAAPAAVLPGGRGSVRRMSAAGAPPAAEP